MAKKSTQPWFVQVNHDRTISIVEYPTQDDAAEAMHAKMTEYPKCSVSCGQVGATSPWWRGANGCGNEMHMHTGKVCNDFASLNP